MLKGDSKTLEWLMASFNHIEGNLLYAVELLEIALRGDPDDTFVHRKNAQSASCVGCCADRVLLMKK